MLKEYQDTCYLLTERKNTPECMYMSNLSQILMVLNIRVQVSWTVLSWHCSHIIPDACIPTWSSHNCQFWKCACLSVLWGLSSLTHGRVGTTGSFSYLSSWRLWSFHVCLLLEVRKHAATGIVLWLTPTGNLSLSLLLPLIFVVEDIPKWGQKAFFYI